METVRRFDRLTLVAVLAKDWGQNQTEHVIQISTQEKVLDPNFLSVWKWFLEHGWSTDSLRDINALIVTLPIFRSVFPQFDQVGSSSQLASVIVFRGESGHFGLLFTIDDDNNLFPIPFADDSERPLLAKLLKTFDYNWLSHCSESARSDFSQRKTV